MKQWKKYTKYFSLTPNHHIPRQRCINRLNQLSHFYQWIYCTKTDTLILSPLLSEISRLSVRRYCIITEKMQTEETSTRMAPHIHRSLPLKRLLKMGWTLYLCTWHIIEWHTDGFAMLKYFRDKIINSPVIKESHHPVKISNIFHKLSQRQLF